MRIVHFHTDGQTAAIFVDPLVEAERGHGHLSELVTSIRRSKLSDLEMSHALLLRNVLGLPLAFWRICMFIRARKPDIVISHNTTGSPIPLLAAWWMGLKIRVYFNHGVPCLGYKGVLSWGLRALERVNCRLASHVLSVSQDMVKHLASLHQSAQPRLILNGSACGIDLEVWDRARYRGSAWRESNQIGADDIVVAFVGRPERRKGFSRALRLWADYFPDPRYKLVLCGGGSDDVLRFVPAVPLNVICLGFVSNVAEVLSNADALILPSLHEGLPYAILEAMACKCIVIANDIEGVRSIIQDKVNGYLINNNSLPEFAHVIRLLGKDLSFFSDVREQATCTASKFSRHLFLPAYLSFLDELVKRQHETL
ncbi:MAG: glycosyltransferase [Nitrosomonadaceae bacterium]|nr:glycosyltransferase [Nitrosomonadaceae bacterium]